MNTLNTRAKHLRSTVGKIVMVLAFAAVIGGLSMVPAFGQDHDRYQGQEDRGQHERERQEERARYERERHERERHEERTRSAYRPYGYSAPLHAPPPVVYPPYQSPGISIFFPFYFR
jgi:hypothetical protein